MSEFPQLLHTGLDTTDVRRLAEFYRELLGLHYRPGDEPPVDGTDDADWLVLVGEGEKRMLAFQQVERRDDPEEPLYVFADPAGHPFCIFVA